MQYLSSKRARKVASITFASALLTFTPLSFAFAGAAAVVTSPFTYNFQIDGTVAETGSMSETSSPYWWVNSGGRMILQGQIGGTIHGSLPLTDPWRVLYAANNPVDTDLGTHPQNLFRLVSRSTWTNVHVETLYKIDKDNFSSSPNRNASNGLLLMLRYKTGGQTLYYAGIRVDGAAVIKKKINGSYYTMAQKTIFPGSYVAGGTVNLLPHNQWLLLGADTVTNANGSVTVKLYLRKPGETGVTKILEATDSGQYGGTAPITEGGYVGLRTDFMDVSFDTFKAVKL